MIEGTRLYSRLDKMEAKLPAENVQPGWKIEDIKELLALLTLEEKIAMLSGSGEYLKHSRTETWGGAAYPAGSGCERLNIPYLQFADGPRGVVIGQATCFPCTMARGASFDRDLERRIGEAMGAEAQALGCDLLGAVCVNVLRHPGWGRAQETYGEDPFHLGEMGRELTLGIQSHRVMATVKHFALNSLENARFKVDVRVDDRALYEVYLPQFKKIVNAGCVSVMSAYNKVNGEYCGQNKRLLNDILREEWGFSGFVHSDWVLGVYSPEGLVAGLDIENPEPMWFGQPLIEAIKSKTISEDHVDAAVSRILRAQFSNQTKTTLLDTYPETLVACSKHTELALEAAEKSAVLLKNDQCLPLNESSISKVAVFGALAKLENTGDQGSSRVNAPYVVTPFQGLINLLGEDRVVFGGDEHSTQQSIQSLPCNETAIVVVGYTAADEGEFIPEVIDLGQTKIPDTLKSILDSNADRRSGLSIGGDRTSLRLKKEQVELVRNVSSKFKKTIVVLVAGSAVLTDEWDGEVSALLQTFYAGMEGGNALANLLFGKVSPSAKLPFSIAREESDYPSFDPNADTVVYDYWHGYTKLDLEGKSAAYPYGHGLSYTDFRYSDLEVKWDGLDLVVQCSIKNIGEYKADEIAQLYIGMPNSVVDRPVKMLKGFERVTLRPNESKTIVLRVNRNELAWYDANTKKWEIEETLLTIMVGGSSDHSKCFSTSIELHDLEHKNTEKV